MYNAAVMCTNLYFNLLNLIEPYIQENIKKQKKEELKDNGLKIVFDYKNKYHFTDLLNNNLNDFLIIIKEINKYENFEVFSKNEDEMATYITYFIYNDIFEKLYTNFKKRKDDLNGKEI